MYQNDGCKSWVIGGLLIPQSSSHRHEHVMRVRANVAAAPSGPGPYKVDEVAQPWEANWTLPITAQLREAY
ncbi:hypothetical protein Q1695_000647 [Nippostrongylus brasiliensis]|nr:hypothetical protein Q1695_000647 [Nippostrongylus brasiliensis]